jgi:hypothetical protein
VESRHWAQLQKGPNKEEKEEETEKDKKGREKEEEEFGSGEGQGEGEIKNKQRTKSIKSEKGTTGGKEKNTRNGEAETGETKSTNESSPFFSTETDKSRPRHQAMGLTWARGLMKENFLRGVHMLFTAGRIVPSSSIPCWEDTGVLSHKVAFGSWLLGLLPQNMPKVPG